MTNFDDALSATDNGFLNVAGSTVTGCILGVSATRMGTVRAESVAINGCTTAGISSRNFGFVRANGVAFSGNFEDIVVDGTSFAQ